MKRSALPASGFGMPPWVVLGIAALVSAMLLVMLVRDRHQQRQLTTRVLSEKGASLIRAVEGALRTVVGFRWTDEELEDLLDKMGQQSDIRFVAITTEEGVVLASNHPESSQNVPASLLRDMPAPPAIRPFQAKGDFLVAGAFSVPRFQERINAFRHRRGHNWHGARQGAAGAAGAVNSPGVSAVTPRVGPEQTLLVVVAYDDAPLGEADQLDDKHVYTLGALLAVVNLMGLAAFLVLRLLARTRLAAQQEIEGLQTALRHRERLAALGSMAAGIAHEIRNPLGAIKGLALFFKENSPPASEEARVADIMTREALRLDRVVGDLLDLARPAALQRSPVRAEELAERLRRLMEPELVQQGVQLTVDIAPDLPCLVVDSDRLTQVLLNLALNSLQAGSSTLALQIGQMKGEVFLRLTDTGEGMDDATLQSVFTPYFTTKARGTGLGLPIVHKIMEEHGGRVVITSRPGQGTEVTLMFPATDETVS